MEDSAKKNGKKNNIAQPKWLLYLAEKLTPRHHSAFISGDLQALASESLPKNILAAARTVARVIKYQMVESLDGRLLFGEILFLYLLACVPDARVAFFPLMVVIALTVAVLRVRDAYIYPPNASRREMVEDAAVVVGSIGASQLAFRFALPMLALPPLKALLAIIAGVLVAEWRRKFHAEDPLDPHHQELKESYIAVTHMNMLFIAVTATLVYTSLEAVPEVVQGRDFILAAAPVSLLCVAYKLKKDRLGATLKPRQKTLFGDPQVGELKHERDMLAVPDKGRLKSFRYDLLIEVLVFILLLIPLGLAVWRWLSADPSAALVEWFQVGVNSGGLVAWPILRIYIGRKNHQLAKKLDQEIKNGP